MNWSVIVRYKIVNAQRSISQPVMRMLNYQSVVLFSCQEPCPARSQAAGWCTVDYQLHDADGVYTDLSLQCHGTQNIQLRCKYQFTTKNMCERQTSRPQCVYRYLELTWFWKENNSALRFRSRGGVVVKALRYTPAGRGFDSRWCHWNFSVT